MIKCEVIEKFTLKDFDLLKNIQRKNGGATGKLYVGDTFECDEKMAKYLTGDNAKGNVVVKIIEVEPEKKEEKKLIYCGDEQTPPQYEELKSKTKKKKGKK